jgi:hypothetical protein
VFIVILRIPEKLDLLLIVTAKLLQKSIKNRQSLFCALGTPTYREKQNATAQKKESCGGCR